MSAPKNRSFWRHKAANQKVMGCGLRQFTWAFCSGIDNVRSKITHHYLHWVIHPGQLNQIPTRSAPAHFMVMDVQKALTQSQQQSFSDFSRRQWSGNCTVPRWGREQHSTKQEQNRLFIVKIILSRIFTWDILGNEQWYFTKDLSSLVEHESGIQQKAAMCLPGSLGITHKIPTSSWCTTKGMWEELVIHFKCYQNIYTHIYSYICLSTEACYICPCHIMSPLHVRQNDKEGFKQGFGSSARDEDNQGCPHECYKGKERKQQYLKQKEKKTNKYQHLPFTMLFPKVWKKPNPKEITCYRNYTLEQKIISS